MCMYVKSGQLGAAAMGLYTHAIHRLIHRMWINSDTMHNLIHMVASLLFSANRKNAVEQVT